MATVITSFVPVANVEEVRKRGYLTVQVEGQPVALFYHNDRVYAVDNRCPHMGFPLDRGTVRDGILTCHWHHARFDLASGGTFDQWADDVRSFPVEVRDGQVWVDAAPHTDMVAHQRTRLRIGLERNLSLVIGKAVLSLLEADPSGGEPFRAGLEFGTRYREMGWGQGLTMHVCFMNLLPYLAAEDRPRALYHGLSAVATDSAGQAPRFMVPPLPGDATGIPTLKRWFRQFIEVRDDEGAERCIVSAIRAGADHRQMADMLFAAVTDHRYIQVGHPADFTNKAFEALDIAGWEMAEPVLTSLVRGYAGASRMEESNAWRYPVDLIAILERSFEALPDALMQGEQRRAEGRVAWPGRRGLADLLLGDDPQASADALLESLRGGCSAETLAGAVAYAAALRIARFHTSNEFGDWDTALHTFTFANAIHQGLRRAPSAELLRGAFDAAMSVYLDRFLNIPAARLPQPNGAGNGTGAASLQRLSQLLDRQQQVNQAAQEVAGYLHHGGDTAALLASIGRLLLREDRDFHTIQMVEAAFRQHSLLDDPAERSHVLIAAIRYLAAHSPTVRAQGQTYTIAQRLHRGEELFRDA
ncbi:MAG TPA: Rieske 2Fe-2S domain-containing protein [Caldilineaceae bacterium]|nr:Rieske 2Fe-2S domain-containing protein [Caldilineaceae bacterium]